MRIELLLLLFIINFIIIKADDNTSFTYNYISQNYLSYYSENINDTTISEENTDTINQPTSIKRDKISKKESISINNFSFQRISGYRVNCDNSHMQYQYDFNLDNKTQTEKNIFKRLYNYLTNANQPYNGKNKKFDLIFVAAPHYSSDIKFALVVAASAQYKTDSKADTPLSTISLSGDFSTSGYISTSLKGIAIFNEDKYRLCHDFSFYSQTSYFWGVGYEMGRYAPKSVYRRVKGTAKIDFLYNAYNSIYLGPTLNFNYINGLHFTEISYLKGEPRMNYNLGIGVQVVYDSRDFAPNAKSGMYLGYEQSISPSAFSNSGVFQKSEVFYRYYRSLWLGGIIAAEFHLASVYGDTPWSVMPYLGGSSRMRGYYEGRYRDRNVAEFQLELRQNLYKRHGMVMWIGAGNVFHDYGKFKFTHTLPNFGIGYRWEFRDRINLRMDIGRGLDQIGIIFNIEEAF